MKTEQLIKNFKLFWQYPAITEKTFYEQEKNNELFIGFPWATVHDQRTNLNVVYNKILPLIDRNKKYYTCCQHIHFYKFISLWKALGITVVYASHKIKGEDNINGIDIKPCPLYAVNYKDPLRNSIFQNKDFLNIERKLLYSFVGGYQPADYMSNIRPKIFLLSTSSDICIINTGVWHFDKLVFTEKQNLNHELNTNRIHEQKTEEYNKILLNSRYSLCPSGSGPNSIRFWEALAVGSIPVLLSDKLELPQHELWDKAIVLMKEVDIDKLRDILNTFGENKERKMRENCLKIYDHFKDNYKNGKSLK